MSHARRAVRVGEDVHHVSADGEMRECIDRLARYLVAPLLHAKCGAPPTVPLQIVTPIQT